MFGPRRSRDNRSRDWGDAAANQGLRPPPDAKRRAGKDVTHRLTLISHFWPPEW